MNFQCVHQAFLIRWWLSLTDILSEPALPYLISWHTGWQRQTPICSHVFRTGAHGKEIPVDKKLHKIREQPSEWKRTPDLLYLCGEPRRHRTDASSPRLLANERQHCTSKGSLVPHKCSYFIPPYFSPLSLAKSCSYVPTLGKGLRVRRAREF